MSLGLEMLALPSKNGRQGLKYERGKQYVPYTTHAMLNERIEDELLKEELRKKYYKLRAVKTTDGLEHDILRDYQVADVQFILDVDHPLVANEMRLGKTLTTCFALKALGMKALVVAPASVLHQWEEECHKAGLLTAVAQGTPKKREKAYQSEVDVVMVSYESVRNDQKLVESGRFEVLVCDEVHRIGNHKTKAHKVIVEIGSKMFKRIGLTGTPIFGEATRLYGVLRFIYPEYFTSYWGFVGRYLNVIEGFWGNEIKGFNPKMRPELEEMMGNFMIQRKQVDHLHWLQKPSEYRIKVDPPTKWRKTYERLYETMELEEREWDAQSPIVLHGLLGRLTLEAKMDMLEDIMVDAEPTIVFLNRSSYITELNDRMKKMGYDVYELYGDLTPKAKKLNIELFQKSDNPRRVIICNIKSAGTGVTLSSATRTVFLEQSWVPEENQQAQERMTGGEAAKAIYRLHVPDTIDDDVQDVVDGKKTYNDVVNNMRRKFQ